MKRIFTSLTFFFALCYTASAQVEIREFSNGQATGNDISGTTITINVTQNELIAKTFNVLNVSANTASLKVRRQRITEVPNWTDGLCWGPNPDPNFEGLCFSAAQMPTNPWTSPNTLTVPASEDANLVIDIHTEGPGCGHYRYYILDGGVVMDSIDIEVCSSLGVEVYENLSFELFPNPSSKTLNVQISTSEEFEVVLTDSKGAVIRSIVLNQSGTIDVSEFSNGVYFAVLKKSGTNIKSLKFLIDK